MTRKAHPLFTGLTRHPELLGLPTSYWLIASVPPLLFFMIAQRFWLALVLLAVCYLAAQWLGRRDAFVLDLVRLRLGRTPDTSGRAFWGGNSYGS